MASEDPERPADGAASEDLDMPLSAALREASRTRRRSVLKGLGGLVVLAAFPGAGTLVIRERRKSADVVTARERAKAAEALLDAGDLRGAKKLTAEARELDPRGHEAAMAFVHASAFDVIDGDGGAAASIALLSDARKLGARDADLAFASLAAAVGVKNDRLVERILKENQETGVAEDGRYAYAAGAAYDLLCDEEAAREYAHASGITLAKIREARSLLFAARIEEARAIIAELPKERRETRVLQSLADRIASFSGGTPAATQAWIDPSWVTELPRSLRLIAASMALGDPNAPSGQSAGLDAALDDADCPLVALVAGRIALAAGDKVSAKAASASAMRMREELEDARIFAARIALIDGDLAQAKELAGEGPDKAMVLTIQAIDSYERGDKARLSEIDNDSRSLPGRFWGISTARALLGDGDAPKPSALDDAIARNEPWADLLSVDAALAAHDVDRAKKLALAWSEGPDSPARKRRRERIAGQAPDADKPK